MKTLPTNSKMRYHYPISSGCLAYFPAALAGVAKHSYIGGAKYNDGALVHLRYVSTEHLDCIGRHLLDLQDLISAKNRGETEVSTLVYDFEEKREILRVIPIEEAILIECNALSWRSLAFSQEQHEKLAQKPLAPAARLNPVEARTPIKVLSFTPTLRVPLIKVLRELGNLSLKDAKEKTDSLPFEIVNNSSFTQAQAKEMLIKVGAFLE